MLAGMDLGDREPDVELPRPSTERSANLEFFTQDAPAVRAYRVDMAARQAAPTRIVPAIGRSSRGTLHAAPAAALASRLGREPVEFPGGRSGYVFRPKTFAARLSEVLGVPP